MIYQLIHCLNYPQLLRITFGVKFPLNLVRFGLQQHRCFASMPLRSNFLLWGHREQDAPEKNNKIRYRECEVRQELYQKHQIRKKAQQDVGLFYS